MIDTRAALAEAQAPRRPDFACADVVAVALPKDCAIRRAYTLAHAHVPFAERARCTRRVKAAAGLLARHAGVSRVDPAGSGPAWGVLELFRSEAVCFRDGRAWFALSGAGGLVRVPSRVVKRAWSID